MYKGKRDNIKIYGITYEGINKFSFIYGDIWKSKYYEDWFLITFDSEEKIESYFKNNKIKFCVL